MVNEVVINWLTFVSHACSKKRNHLQKRRPVAWPMVSPMSKLSKKDYLGVSYPHCMLTKITSHLCGSISIAWQIERHWKLTTALWRNPPQRSGSICSGWWARQDIRSSSTHHCNQSLYRSVLIFSKIAGLKFTHLNLFYTWNTIQQVYSLPHCNWNKIICLLLPLKSIIADSFHRVITPNREHSVDKSIDSRCDHRRLANNRFVGRIELWFDHNWILPRNFNGNSTRVTLT